MRPVHTGWSARKPGGVAPPARAILRHASTAGSRVGAGARQEFKGQRVDRALGRHVVRCGQHELAQNVRELQGTAIGVGRLAHLCQTCRGLCRIVARERVRDRVRDHDGQLIRRKPRAIHECSGQHDLAAGQAVGDRLLACLDFDRPRPALSVRHQHRRRLDQQVRCPARHRELTAVGVERPLRARAVLLAREEDLRRAIHHLRRDDGAFRRLRAAAAGERQACRRERDGEDRAPTRKYRDPGTHGRRMQREMWKTQTNATRLPPSVRPVKARRPLRIPGSAGTARPLGDSEGWCKLRRCPLRLRPPRPRPARRLPPCCTRRIGACASRTS